jgi:hypothetical protein
MNLLCQYGDSDIQRHYTHLICHHRIVNVLKLDSFLAAVMYLVLFCVTLQPCFIRNDLALLMLRKKKLQRR